MIIENVPYFPQVDNKLYNSTSCYMTSLAMVIQFCLERKNLGHLDIGCKDDQQMEDYFTDKCIQAGKDRGHALTAKWLFNKFMGPFAYKDEFVEGLGFDALRNHLISSKLPVVIHGYFKGIGGVGGHINCCVGFDGDEIICHDPWGNAEDGYKEHETAGYAVKYPLKYFIYPKTNYCGEGLKCHLISEII